MGEETSWFDFLPGVENLKAFMAHWLGRETPDQRFYFRWQMFGDSQFSISHVLGAVLVLIFAILAGLSFYRAVARGGQEAIVPPARFNLRNALELFTDAVYSTAEGVMGPKNARRFLPFIGTLAVFIFFSNLLGLIPGFIPPTSMMKTNFALAGCVFLVTHIWGLKEHGPKYLKHFMGPFLPIAPLMVLIEIVSHIARPVSLTMRLMGNIAADHKVVTAFFVAVPILLPVPFLVLGMLVVIIQTLVFCLLTMVYIQGAIAHEEH